MTSYIIGCDNIVGHSTDAGFIRDASKVLEDAGHQVESVGVGPNHVQSKGLSGSSKGKVGIYLVGGACLGTWVDFLTGLTQGYYHYKYVWFAFCSWTAKNHTNITEHDLKNKPMVRAHDDNFSTSFKGYLGKTADYFFNDNREHMYYVWGDSPEELARKILNNGEGDSENKQSNGSTIKEAIQKLLTHWDGEVECYIRGDEVHINKVRDPEEYHVGIIEEGVNVTLDNTSVTDVNPETINFLVVTWTKGSIEFRDENLIKRFGEKRKDMEAVKKIVTTEEVKSDSSSDTDTGTDDTGGTGENAAGGDVKSSSKTKSKSKSKSKSNSDSEEDGEDTGDGETTTRTTVTTVPIDNYKEAMNFANTEWNKIKRNDGRVLECQVAGSCKWKNGEWCKVYLPSFNIDGYMYITRTSQSCDDINWTTNLTLVDYPPGWGKEVIENNNEDEGEDSDAEEIEPTDDTSSGDGEASG